MSYNILLTDHFKREAKKLIKKYASLSSELSNLFDELAVNPTLGTPLGNDIYKIRISIASKGKGYIIKLLPDYIYKAYKHTFTDYYSGLFL